MILSRIYKDCLISKTLVKQFYKLDLSKNLITERVLTEIVNFEKVEIL